MTLREERVLFTTLKCRLILWINEREDWSYGKVECAEDEGMVHSQRMVKIGTEKAIALDVTHNPKGMHPQGKAVDLLIYINGDYIRSGDHPIWKEIDQKAQELHPKLSLGLEFHDANHLSFGEGDQA